MNMKFIFTIKLILLTNILHSSDFGIEILSSDSNVRVTEIPGVITYRQFQVNSNWKDTLGDWGILECTGTFTLLKENKTILKNYCKGTNVEDENFWLIMDRESDNFDSGIGEIRYVQGNGKFKKYIGAKCVYAVSHLKRRIGTFIKAKCNLIR